MESLPTIATIVPATAQHRKICIRARQDRNTHGMLYIIIGREQFNISYPEAQKLINNLADLMEQITDA